MGKLVEYDEKNDKIVYVDLNDDEHLIAADSMKHLVETSSFQMLNIQGYQLQKYLTNFETFIDRYEAKFCINNFIYVQGDFEEPKLNFLIENLPGIFEKFINGSELTLVMSSKGFKRLLDAPRLWQPRQTLNRLSMVINYVDDDKIFGAMNKIKVEDVLKFVEGSRYGKEGGYTFSLKNVEDDFVEKYFKVYSKNYEVANFLEPLTRV